MQLSRNKTAFVICSCCNGHGKVDNPAFSNGFTAEEWNDPDFADDYDDADGKTSRDRYLEGFYDVHCPECKGSGKLLVPIVAMLTFAEKRYFAGLRRDARIKAEIDRESRMERMMGC